MIKQKESKESKQKEPKEDKDEFLRHLGNSKKNKLTRHSSEFLSPQIPFRTKIKGFGNFFELLEPVRNISISGDPSPSMPIYLDSDTGIITALSNLKRPTIIEFDISGDNLAKEMFSYIENNAKLKRHLKKDDKVDTDLLTFLPEFLDKLGYTVINGSLELA